MHTVAVGILVQDQRVLLGLRSAGRRAFPGRWALPGGHVEPGESETGALRRELREELGIDVLECDGEPTSRLHVTSGAPGTEVRLSAWRVRAWDGRPGNVSPHEHDRLAWFTLGEFDQLRWAHPEHREVLRELLDPTSP
ncbi:NUDIX domain-containing protein [Kineococcus rhizosphaerae]|uniref:8-oxo-dGTP diphosphatase n=1 Tax=Kineococcus rhizosphaerae TaxID=559628 RepID=A0A2T0QZU1_9ACTN|nr:NUDIX domain-containing protein [Kineococcus rhizosphaerae]PRY12219.1 mutator protein MutT [Kineococcus rhizosphaerae]